MSVTFTIGDLADAAGVPISTVRHYEREGLLQADGRSESNYRMYGQRSLDRLRFIRAAQASGLSLDDVSSLLAFQDGSVAPCRSVQELIGRRLEETEERLSNLRRVRSALRVAMVACKARETSGSCEVIESLKRAASGELARRSGKKVEKASTLNPGSRL